jgi:PAS domain S-box-containing protein
MAHDDRNRVPPPGLWEPVTVEFLTAIIEHVAHPIFVKDRSFRWVLLNTAFCTMVGHRREEMLGRSDHDFFPKHEADFFRQKDVEMFASGRAVDIEEEWITDASGCRHALATTKVPLRDAAGEVTHLVGIIHDITRLKAAEERLRQNHGELEARVRERTAALRAAQDELVRKERLAVLGQLAGGLAHQIRNPLGAIKNAAYILQTAARRAAPDPDAARAIAVIHDEVERANRFITDLLDYARVRPPQVGSIDVVDVIERAFQSQEVPPRVAIARRYADAPRVAIDAGQVQGALFNLIRNAVEAMPDGGTLTVTTRGDGDAVVVGIADTGAGVPAEVASRLFEPLVTTKPLGLGLGLVTARALVENQGGSITWCAPPDGGTRFDVRLPRAGDGATGSTARGGAASTR